MKDQYFQPPRVEHIVLQNDEPQQEEKVGLAERVQEGVTNTLSRFCRWTRENSGTALMWGSGVAVAAAGVYGYYKVKDINDGVNTVKFHGGLPNKLWAQWQHGFTYAPGDSPTGNQIVFPGPNGQMTFSANDIEVEGGGTRIKAKRYCVLDNLSSKKKEEKFVEQDVIYDWNEKGYYVLSPESPIPEPIYRSPDEINALYGTSNSAKPSASSEVPRPEIQ